MEEILKNRIMVDYLTFNKGYVIDICILSVTMSLYQK